ncbi:MAG: hypothetical protein R3F56_23715 [Planctomycetota bacterium]
MNHARAHMHRICSCLLLLSLCATACSSYVITVQPPPPQLPPHVATARPPMTLAVESTYAPFVDGELSTTQRYPRNHGLGREDRDRYRRAFEASGQFTAVTLAPPGDGPHCRLSVVSGREPPHELRRAVSILLTLGLLSHEQREIVRLEAAVSAPGRAVQTYRLEARITTNARSAGATRLHRPPSFSGPENDLVAALVALMGRDGWLDGASRPGPQPKSGLRSELRASQRGAPAALSLGASRAARSSRRECPSQPKSHFEIAHHASLRGPCSTWGGR